MTDAAEGRSVIRAQGILFIIAFVATLVILFTDKNLQTDFDTKARYFIHWYGLLATGVLSLIGGIILAAGPKRSLSVVGVFGSLIMIVFLAADTLTYSMLGVGFNFTQFATYLFGITKYPGSLSYIPGLYDGLFAVYVVTLLVGIIAVRRNRR